MSVGARLSAVVLLIAMGGFVRAGEDEKVIKGELAATDPIDPALKKELDIESPHKVHKLDVEAGNAFIIDLESDAFDAVLRVEDPAGDTIALDDDSAGDLNSRVVIAAAQKGTFRLIAASLQGTGAYALKIRPTKALLTKQGKLTEDSEAHAVKLTPGFRYFISLTSKDFDAFLRVEDANGQVLAKDDDGGSGNNAQLTLEPTREGIYKVLVSSFGDTGRGAYSLTVASIGAAAVPIPLVGNNAKGELTEKDARDKLQKRSPSKLYTYKMSPGVLYTIDLKSDDFDPFMRLESPGGDILKVDDDGGGDLNSRITYVPTEAGEYRIFATSLGGGGNFTLSVQASKSKLALSETKELKEASASHRFKAAAGKRYVIDLTSKAFDAFLRLNSPGGNEVATDDDGGDGLNSRITFEAAENGAYEIVVTSFDGDGRGEYQLTARELEAQKE